EETLGLCNLEVDEGIEDDLGQRPVERLGWRTGRSRMGPILAPLHPVAAGVGPERIHDEGERRTSVRVGVLVRGAGGEETAAGSCDEVANHVVGRLPEPE